MNDYEREIFYGRCPYTGKPCDKDIDCVKCEVDEEEKNDTKRKKRNARMG